MKIILTIFVPQKYGAIQYTVCIMKFTVEPFCYIPVMLSNDKRFKFTFNNGIIRLIPLLASATQELTPVKLLLVISRVSYIRGGGGGGGGGGGQWDFSSPVRVPLPEM